MKGLIQRGRPSDTPTKMTLTNRRLILTYARVFSPARNYYLDLKNISNIAVETVHATLPAVFLGLLGLVVGYALMLRVAEPDLEPLVRDLRQRFRAWLVSVRWYRGAEDDIGEDLQRAEDYLSLVGFVMLVLGGVGVWSVTRVFVHQKLRHVAVLKCLGASWRRVFGVYVAQVLVLGLAGSRPTSSTSAMTMKPI